jgi:uncharacterized protein YcbK (DUF882 family)
MQLTTNFNLSEFNKHGFALSETVLRNIQALANNLQILRDEVKKPIKITSGYRSPEHNAKVGGVKSSRHITGEAADFKIAGMTPKEVAAVIEKLIAAGKMEEGGLGTYSTWVHYDHRNVKARWAK